MRLQARCTPDAVQTLMHAAIYYSKVWMNSSNCMFRMFWSSDAWFTSHLRATTIEKSQEILIISLIKRTVTQSSILSQKLSKLVSNYDRNKNRWIGFSQIWQNHWIYLWSERKKLFDCLIKRINDIILVDHFYWLTEHKIAHKGRPTQFFYRRQCKHHKMNEIYLNLNGKSGSYILFIQAQFCRYWSNPPCLFITELNVKIYWFVSNGFCTE